jgi:hypothetical protein
MRRRQLPHSVSVHTSGLAKEVLSNPGSSSAVAAAHLGIQAKAPLELSTSVRLNLQRAEHR